MLRIGTDSIAARALDRIGSVRSSEAASLTWGDVDVQRGAVTLDENKTDDPRAWALGPPVLPHRLLERVEHHIRALGVVNAVTDHEARAVVDQDQRERRGLPDVPLHEVEVPQVIGPHCLVTTVVLLPHDLRRSIPGVLHHAAGRVHRDFDALAP